VSGPTIETARLVLRPLTTDDLDELAVLHAEPSFWWYPLRRGQTRDETATFIDRAIQRGVTDGCSVQAVVERDSGRLAGWAGLAVPHFLPEILPAVEVGWRLGENFRGKGYATEAGRAWVRHGFDVMGLDRLVSIYEPDNEASGVVMRKLGFALDRVTVQPAAGVTVHVLALDRPPAVRECSGG
jgi:RimJ/RimL family protein N-acetyltransferase